MTEDSKPLSPLALIFLRILNSDKPLDEEIDKAIAELFERGFIERKPKSIN